MGASELESKLEQGATVGVLSDIHGNRWALEAVLKFGEERGVCGWIDLGDLVWGVLDPTGTIELLRSHAVCRINGNQDREVLDTRIFDAQSRSLAFTRSSLTDEQLNYLANSCPTLSIGHQLFLCHGTPESDTEYLMESVGESGNWESSLDEIERKIAGFEHELILCGHTHLQRLVRLPNGQIVMNPGSVGLPAYSDDLPYPHAMEAGTPHARFALIRKTPQGWATELHRVEYDWGTAAEVAEKNGRRDWAFQLKSGRVRKA